MNRMPVAAVALVAVLVTAGCSVPFGPGTTSPAPTSTPSPTPAPPVYGASIEDGRTVAAAHREALREAGSFTYELSATLEESSGRFTVDRTVEVDLAEETLSVETAMNRSEKNWSVNANTWVGQADEFTRLDGPLGTEYVTADPVSGNASRYLGANLGDLLASATLARRNSTTVDGVDVDVYVVADDFAAPAGTVTYFDSGTVEERRLEVAVSEAGVIRRLDYRTVAADGRVLELSVTYSSVGETVPAEPSWTGTARERVGTDPVLMLSQVALRFETRLRGSEIAAVVEDRPRLRRPDRFRKAHASGVTRVRSTASRELSMDYVPRSVDGADPDEFAVYRFDRANRTFVRVPTTLEGRVASVYVEDGTFAVLHVPAWERNGDGSSG